MDYKKFFLEGNKSGYKTTVKFLEKNKKIYEKILFFSENNKIENVSLTQKIWHFINDINEIPKCHCGNNNNFISLNKGYTKNCSNKCIFNSPYVREKTKQTNLERYGVEFITQNKEIKEKTRQTNLERYGSVSPSGNKEIKEKIRQNNLEKYGVEYQSQREEIKEKIKQTNLERYGVECPSQCEKIKEKVKQTNMERYGVEYPSQLEETREKAKRTNLERYGVEHAKQNKEIKEKVKQTNLEKYGVEYPSQCEEIKEKVKQTNLERYGVEYPNMNSERFNSYKESIFNRYGVDNFSKTSIFKNIIKEQTLNRKTEKLNKINEKINFLFLNRPIGENLNEIKNLIKKKYLLSFSEDFKTEIIDSLLKSLNLKNYESLPFYKEKIKQTMMEKYGVDNYNKSNLSKEKKRNQHLIYLKEKYNNFIDYNHDDKIITLKCNENHIFKEKLDFINQRKNLNYNLCTVCNPYKSFSSVENEIKDFLNELGIDFIPNDRNKIGYELDILIPDINFAIEFNGLYWHNELHKEKNYHLMKTKLCEEKGISLFHIFEDEWYDKKEIIKSMIKNKLRINDKIIYARKCIIKEVSNKESSLFLKENHLQGNVNSKVKIGLFYNDNLVSLMTFCMGRKFMKGDSENYELMRFVNKKNTLVIGGASKILNYFIKNYHPKKIVTFSDLRYSNGNLYNKLGFEYLHETKPNYFYVKNLKREHRFKYRKDQLLKEGFDSKKSEHEIMLERKIYRIYDCGHKKFVLYL